MMFAIIAAFLAALAFIFNGAQAHTDTWFDPLGLLCAAVAVLALHFAPISGGRK